MIPDSPPEGALSHCPQVEVKQFGQDQDDLQNKEKCVIKQWWLENKPRSQEQVSGRLLVATLDRQNLHFCRF